MSMDINTLYLQNTSAYNGYSFHLSMRSTLIGNMCIWIFVSMRACMRACMCVCCGLLCKVPQCSAPCPWVWQEQMLNPAPAAGLRTQLPSNKMISPSGGWLCRPVQFFIYPSFPLFTINPLLLPEKKGKCQPWKFHLHLCHRDFKSLTISYLLALKSLPFLLGCHCIFRSAYGFWWTGATGWWVNSAARKGQTGML